MADSFPFETLSAPGTTSDSPPVTPDICWPLPPRDFPFRLPRNHVQLWAFPLDLEPERLRALESFLSRKELDRANRYHFPLDRHRFLAGRGQLRLLLSRYLESDPAALDFNYGCYGKPGLSEPWAGTNLHFNLAHSDGLAVAAIADAECGIDVEQIRFLDDFDDLVARFFSPREKLGFKRLPAEEKAEAFFNLWTRKEAWLKAVGEGIGYALDRVEVSYLPREPARLLALPEAAGPVSRWTLKAFEPAPGFAAALALAKAPGSISIFRLKID